MRCRKCGASVPTDSKFCNYCGARINHLPTRDGSMPARPRDENFDDISTVHEEKIEEPENRGQRALIIFLIVLAGVLFTAVALLVYQGMKKNQRTIVTPVAEEEEPGTIIPESETVPPTETPADPATEEPGRHAEGDVFERNGITYKVEDGALTLERCNATEAILVLPEEVDGLPLKVIGTRAFEFCNHLQYIDIPEGVTTVREYAFSHITGLREIVLPNSLSEFKDGVFDYTGGFTVISNPDTLGYWLATNNGIPWSHGDSITVISE